MGYHFDSSNNFATDSRDSHISSDSDADTTFANTQLRRSTRSSVIALNTHQQQPLRRSARLPRHTQALCKESKVMYESSEESSSTDEISQAVAEAESSGASLQLNQMPAAINAPSSRSKSLAIQTSDSASSASSDLPEPTSSSAGMKSKALQLRTATAPTVVTVTIVFLRDDGGLLFQSANGASSDVEWAIHFSSSLTRHNRRQKYEGLQAVNKEDVPKRQPSSQGDTLYSVTVPASMTIADLKNHVRRLLNVFFSHPEPELLDMHIKFYDENAPYAGSLSTANHFDEFHRLSNLLQQSNSTITSSGSHELLGVVTRITKSEAASFCSRASWALLPNPPVWRLSIQSESFRRRDEPYWEHAIERKRHRKVADLIPTEMLLVSESDQKVAGLDAREVPLRTAALFGVGLEN